MCEIVNRRFRNFFSGACVPFLMLNDHRLNAKEAARTVARLTSMPPDASVRDRVRRQSQYAAKNSHRGANNGIIELVKAAFG